MDFIGLTVLTILKDSVFNKKADYFKSGEFQDIEGSCKSVCVCLHVHACACVCLKQRPAVAILTATLPSWLQPIFVHFGQTFKLTDIWPSISSYTQHCGVWACP